MVDQITEEGLRQLLGPHIPTACGAFHMMCRCGWHEEFHGDVMSDDAPDDPTTWNEYLTHILNPTTDTKEVH